MSGAFTPICFPSKVPEQVQKTSYNKSTNIQSQFLRLPMLPYGPDKLCFSQKHGSPSYPTKKDYLEWCRRTSDIIRWFRNNIVLAWAIISRSKPNMQLFWPNSNGSPCLISKVHPKHFQSKAGGFHDHRPQCMIILRLTSTHHNDRGSNSKFLDLDFRVECE